MIVRGETLLAGQEPFAGEAVAEALADAGRHDPHGRRGRLGATAPRATPSST